MSLEGVSFCVMSHSGMIMLVIERHMNRFSK